MKRKATSKRLRFEVFNRDHFTCQYCGAQPPSVVLVCDHIIPVSKGGLTSSENLVTAYESCNAGKADKKLGDAIIRPDADLMYLNIQQEIAELQRYDQAKEERSLALEKAAIQIIKSCWFSFYEGNWHPSIQFVSQVISKYDPYVAEKAFEATAIAFNQGKLKKHKPWFPYTWAVARNANEEMYSETEDLNEQEDYEEQIFLQAISDLKESVNQWRCRYELLDRAWHSATEWNAFFKYCLIHLLGKEELNRLEDRFKPVSYEDFHKDDIKDKDGVPF
jgi:hypothetical protein